MWLSNPFRDEITSLGFLRGMEWNGELSLWIRREVSLSTKSRETERKWENLEREEREGERSETGEGCIVQFRRERGPTKWTRVGSPGLALKVWREMESQLTSRSLHRPITGYRLSWVSLLCISFVSFPFLMISTHYFLSTVIVAYQFY